MSPDVVLFDFPLTVGCARLAADAQRVTRFDINPTFAPLAQQLALRARLGVVASGPAWSSRSIEQTLEKAGVLPYFDRSLLFHFATHSATHLRVAATSASALRCVLVSPDRVRRGEAIDAGMLAAPHVALVAAVLGGESLVYLRIEARDVASLGGLRAAMASGLLVPVHASKDASPTLLALAPASAAARITAMGFQVQRIGALDAALTDLYLLRPGAEQSTAFRQRLDQEQLTWLESSQGLVVGVPPTRNVDDLHPPGAGHGHTLELRASRSLLATAAAPASLPAAALAPLDKLDLEQKLNAALVQKHLDPWIGAVTLPGGATLTSRHAYHPQNSVAAKAVAASLETILGAGHAWTEEFEDAGGGMLLNVVGEIPGTQSPAELVVLGAHLDSTGRNSPGFVAATFTAPGADDNASGVAGVLAAAEVLQILAQRQPPKRTLRFVLFNAEEVGMSGSYHHAKQLKDHAVNVVAMLQMDMIGRKPLPDYNGKLQYEMHATAPDDFPSVDPMVMQLSRDVADLVSDSGTLVSAATLVAQIYPVAGCKTDPGAVASDHRQFVIRQFPACLVAEDLFADACGDAAKSANQNPTYHTVNDTVVDCGYAADIARAVAAAAWRLATG